MSSDINTIFCGEATVDAAANVSADDPSILRLSNLEPNRNVHLHINDISRSLITAVPPRFADLMEIATYVYVADQAYTRGGDDVENMGANWRRRLQFEIPVRSLDFWRRHDVATALRDTLSFLSEDEYTFVFRKYRKPIAPEQYFNFAPFGGGPNPESVILFSGGLDSLGGAVQEIVVDGRPVLLVTHQSTTKLLNRLKMLRQMIDGRAKGPRPYNVTVDIHKDERLNREYTQRSRSFLYASLGATLAHICGLEEIRFYENGTISLNLPISRQVVGAKATRTTHPKVLAGFRQIFSLIADKPFGVTNRFLWKTKGEVVDLILKAGCGGMIEWSTSCTHTWELSNAKPHCGHCSQCIDRRFAVLAAGAGQFERADSYKVDLLTQSREAGEPRTMLASYVETAQQVAQMSEMEFFMRFGEVARIVRQLGGSADENARKVYDLYRRHGLEVTRVVDGGIGENASKIRSRTLPESCLLRMVHDPGTSAEWAVTSNVPNHPPEARVPQYFLRKQGQKWELRFGGHEIVSLIPTVGLVYLWEVLRFPRKRFTVSDLVASAHGERAALPMWSGSKDLDAHALRAYAQRLAEINEEIDEAKENHDLARQEKLASDRDAFLVQMKAAGFKRRSKRNHSDLNNLRNSVCNAIKRSMATIRKYDSHAYKHFQASMTFGFSVMYHPVADIAWEF